MLIRPPRTETYYNLFFVKFRTIVAGQKKKHLLAHSNRINGTKINYDRRTLHDCDNKKTYERKTQKNHEISSAPLWSIRYLKLSDGEIVSIDWLRLK